MCFSEHNKNLVNFVCEPLPVFDEHVVSSTSEDDDDNEAFIDPREKMETSPSSRRRHRGYYMTARRYEFYLRVFNSISHE